MPTPGFNFILIVILTTLFSGSLSQTACGIGWFGTGCKYKCWCPVNKCKLDGECMSGITCVTGWFGPSCQYRNRMISARNNHSWIKDELIGTCNPGTPDITIDFDDYYYFTWLRIVYNRTALGTNAPGAVYFFFKEVTGNTIDCSYKTVFIVDPSTVDIHCNLLTRINQIILRGNDTLRICELFLSGGRNLALKQQTNQSSVLDTWDFRYESSLAVDGFRNSSFTYKSCTHTRINIDKDPTWFLYYSTPVVISRVVLYNRDVLPERLQRFSFKMFDANDSIVQFYKEPGKIKAVYRIAFWSPRQGNKISIQTSSVLSLCEVETFGDMNCSRLKWGLDCLNNCNCQPSQLCSPITGKCDKGCSPGLYGRLCDIKCPTNCLKQECFRDTGICVTCENGYMGYHCDKECLPNKYGSNCLLSCHTNCRKRICSKHEIETGNCSVRVCSLDGMCNACLDTAHYGFTCTLTCSTNCLFNRCDSKHGACYSCKIGFYGNNCSQACSENCQKGCELGSGVCYGCKSTFYGKHCVAQCPIKCEKLACHDTNGTCLNGCPRGFYGDMCSYACPKTCKNQNCHGRNGSCLDECENGVFGVNCSDICPRRCRNRICDFTKGTCYHCDYGYYGGLCNLRCSEDCTGNTCNFYSGECSTGNDIDYHPEVVVPIVFVALLLVLGTLFLWKRKDESGAFEKSNVE